MKSKERKRCIAALVANAAVFLSMAYIAVTGVLYGAGKGQVGNYVIGLGYFKPFTMDSNILAGISSLILVICNIKNLIQGKDTTPKWAVTFHLMAAASLSLTMVVAAFFLAPMNVILGKSYFSMFAGDMFFFHLVNPLLAIISFSWLQTNYHFRRRDCILGAIPTIIYSFVYLLMVVVWKKWDDFYNFTFGGRYYLIPAVFVVIYSLVLAASLLLIREHNRKNGGFH